MFLRFMINKSDNSILILDPAGNLWGSEKVLLDFLNSNLVQNTNIGLCCPPNTPLAKAAIKLGVIVYPYFKSNLHRRSKLLRFIAAIGLFIACVRHKADVMYINQAGATRVGLFVGRILKTPVVPHVRLLEDVYYIERLNSTAKNMPFIIVISEFIADAFKDKNVKNRVRVIYDAYELQHYSSDGQAVMEKRSLCCAGRLVPMKGQDVLISAVAVLFKRKLKATLDIYGEGLQGENFETDLKRLVCQSHLDSHITFKGYFQNVPAEMRSYWAMICPSHIEPLGRVIFEAWDAGILPIVGKFSGGAAEVIIASGGGLLYEEQKPEIMADVIQECINMPPKKRAEYVKRGKQWLSNNCSPDKYSHHVIKILDEARKF